MTEIWRDIDGYESLYQVSNFGRVRSSYRGGRILKSTLNTYGYPSVDLCRNGKAKKFPVHRLVALAFIPNPENKPEVNHINGDKTDNRAVNLEWVTRSENAQHALKTGLRRQGEDSSDAKLTNEQVVYIRDNPDGLTQRKLAEVLDVGGTTIGRIRRGERYKTAGGAIRTEKLSDPHRIPDETRDEIRRLYVRGSHEFGSTALARKFGVNPQTVLNILKEATR